MANSIKLIDFNREQLIREAIYINRVLPGVFSYEALKGLYFDEYESILAEAKRIHGEQ